MQCGPAGVKARRDLRRTATGEEQFVEMTNWKWRKSPPPNIGQNFTVNPDKPLRASDAIPPHARNHLLHLRLDGLVLDLNGLHIIHEVTRRKLPAGTENTRHRGQSLLRRPLRHIEFVEEAGRIHEVEGASLEWKVENVSDDEARTKRKFVRGEGRFGSGESAFILVEYGERAVFADPLRQTLDPQRRRASDVKYVPPFDISEEVEFAVGEGYEVGFVLVALFGGEGVVGVQVASLGAASPPEEWRRWRNGGVGRSLRSGRR